MQESRKGTLLRKDLEESDLTEKIIGAAIAVHKALGPGFIESVYETALVHELAKRGMKVGQQIEVPVMYDGIEAGRHRLDLFVEDKIVVELKAVHNLEDVHFSVVRSYLKAVKQRNGLLLNFSAPVLEIKRVIVS